MRQRDSEPVAIKRPAAIPEPTPRQREILEMIARGYVHKEVAEQLGVERQTVKNQLLALYMKWSVHSQSEAVALALHHGFIKLA